MQYVPLNVKTEYTLLNSMIRMEDLINFAIIHHLTSLAIADNNMCGAMEFYKACVSHQIKPIIGLDVIIESFHILLYAKNNKGYHNLLKISTSYSENELNVTNLKNFSDSLICVVPFESYSLLKTLDFFEDIFVGYKNKQEYDSIVEKNKVFSKEVLYLEKEDGNYFNYLKAIENNTTIQQEKTIYHNAFFLADEIPFDLKNNIDLLQKCDLKIEFGVRHIPKFPCPEGYTSQEYLKHLCKEGLKKKFGNTVSIKYIERLKYELSIIEEMDFCDYFLIVADYVKFAKEKNILVGPGRGSAAGSLVSYCLSIIEVDPIKYHLIFERFLNKDRVTMPDIDIDFDGARREEVINYCKEKYGSKNVTSIITFSSLTAKQVVKDVGKTLNMNSEMVDYFARMLKAKISLRENYHNSERIQNHLNKNPEIKKLFDISLKLENIKKHISSHASGIVISDVSIDEQAPLVYYGEEYLTGYTMNFLEELGLIKMDFLGIKTLTTIDSILKDIGLSNQFSVPLDDVSTFEVFQKGQTMGIFQFESQGMISLLKRMKPATFTDLYNIIALYRPGPMGNIDSYIRRSKNQEPIHYFHPDLVSVLKPTYGIIIYQEQIMQIASILADYTLGEADILRRAMSKKKEDILLNEKDKFISRAVKKGYPEELVEKIYQLILKFAEYGFPKAHAVAYAMISYKMAYLKAHYKTSFMKNMLNTVIGSIHDTNNYLIECHEMGIPILNPDIQTSGLEYQNISNSLLFPLTQIKEVGSIITNAIVSERKKSKFFDIYDFFKRMNYKIVTKQALENLIYSGSLDSFGFTRKTLIHNLDILLNYVELLDDLDDESIIKPEIMNEEEFSKKEILFYEKQVFGFYLNSHPVNEYRKKYKKLITISSIRNYLDKTIELIASIDSLKESRTKSGERICFMKVSDELLTLDAPIFSKAYLNTPPLAVNDIIKITGRVSSRNGKDQIIVNKIEILEHLENELS